MTAMTILALGTARPYTVADLSEMPEDGRRYELIDGTLLVSPSPTLSHQRASGRFHMALGLACPPGLEVFSAPLDVRLADDTQVQPDLVVLDQADLGGDHGDWLPVLAVEILSPSTRLVDLNLKKARFEIAGCPSYWVVDPGLGDAPPSVTAWELRDGRYVEAGSAAGDEVFAVDAPFEIEVVPSQLVIA